MAVTHPEAPETAPPRPATPLRYRITAWAVVAGLAVVAVAFALLARPVTTPVQDCGTSFGWLREGRMNVFADPADPPAGLTEAQVRDNNEHPCQERVTDRAVPAGYLLAAGALLAVAAALTEGVLRAWNRRKRIRAAYAEWSSTAGATAGSAPVPAASEDRPSSTR